MKGFMFPRHFWNEIGIGFETLLFHIGSIGIYRIGFPDVWTIKVSRIRSTAKTVEEDLPF